MTTSEPVRPEPRSRGRRRDEPRRPGRARAVEGLGTPALVLGVIAVGVAIRPALFGPADQSSVLAWVAVGAGLVAIVVGFVGARRAFHDPARTGGAALGGLALGLVGLAVGLWLVVPGLLGIGTFGEGLTLDECMHSASGQQQQRICASQHLDEYRARYPGRLDP